MADEGLGKELRMLGMDAASYRALALLPLVQVAWADGTVQEAERDLILTLARERYALGDEGLLLLRNWLSHRPRPAYVRRGQRALATLCRSADAGSDLFVAVASVIELAKEVARAAGGFYGQGAISSFEANAIDEIAAALNIEHARPWVSEDDPTMIPPDADAYQEGPAVEIRFDPERAHPVDRPPVGSGAAPDPSGPSEPVRVRSRGTLVHYDELTGEQCAPIDEQGLTIGRGRENTIQVNFDGQVSRRHCRVFRRNRQFYVEDLGSTTGTWINGERVIERRLLGGERLHVGAAAFLFQLSPEDVD